MGNRHRTIGLAHLLPSAFGVVGAGQLGSGIAQVAAVAKLPVVLVDACMRSLEKATAQITKNLDRSVASGKLSQEDATSALARIHSTTNTQDLRDVDFLVEAVPEDELLKKSIFAELDGICKPTAILSSNTSSISITRLASATNRPGNVIGMHFMNPPPLMKLLEVIGGKATEQLTYDRAQALALHLNKTVVFSADRPGFIVNRLLMPMINEAFFALMEGVASADDIDLGMKYGTNQPMGPLALADFIESVSWRHVSTDLASVAMDLGCWACMDASRYPGRGVSKGLDTCLSIMRVLRNGIGEDKYRPCPLLVQYVDAGWLGVKTKRGVYLYPDGKHAISSGGERL